MRLITFLGVLWMMGAEAFALSGTVKDNKGTAIPGALVSLVSDTSVSRTTDANGGFTIEKPTSINGGKAPGVTGGNLAGLGIRGNRLHLLLPASVPGGSLTLYAIQGRNRVELPLGPLGAGAHPVDLPELAPGVYSMRFALGPFAGSAHLVHTGNGTHLLPRISGEGHASSGAPNAAALRRQAAADVDTLLVKKTGFVAVRKPITSYDQTGIAVVMASDSVSSLPPTTDYSAPGPFTTVVEANVGPNGAYTIYRPEPLGKDGFIHAPIIFGNGINWQVSGMENFLRSIASHGFVIIGCNILTGGPNNAGNNTAMTNGLNWILQQNGTAGSKYQGKLAVKRAATMGYSVGGTAAVDIGGHEAVMTVVSIHGHISKAVLHGTLLQTSGTRDNVGLPMQQQTFANSKVPTFLGTVTNADHGYITQANGGVERPAIVAWLRYWIYNDTGARSYFYGNDCVMCKAPWENPQRKLWE